jgi:hypothetical protein
MTDRRKQALDILVDNARRVSEEQREEVIKWSGIVRGEVNKKVAFLPGYVPYVGKSYFDAKLKILVYAMSQNLSDDHTLARELAENWVDGDKSLALNRQNACYEQNGPDAPRASMNPLDTGHVPILCGLLSSLLTDDAPPPSNIYDSIAATNLSKFSFRSTANRTCDSSFSFNQCWKWFSGPEIRELDPDVILCLGNRVYNVVSNAVKVSENSSRPRVFKAAFPSLLVINRWFKVERNHPPLRPRLLSEADLRKSVAYNDHNVKYVLGRDDKYFRAMLAQFKDQKRKQMM